jgi:acetyl-CoA synthetase
MAPRSEKDYHFTTGAMISRASAVMDEHPPFAWWPDPRTKERSNLHTFIYELGLETYRDLHRYSVESRTAFWERVLRRLGIAFDRPPDSICDLTRGVRDPEWLPGALYDVTRSCFLADREKVSIVTGREGSTAIETMTYGELERLVNRFASGLRESGFRPDDAIALYLPMTPSCVAAYLGAVRAGLRVVSIADSFTPEELRKRMLIGGARTLVTTASYVRAGRTIDLYAKVREALRDLDGDPRAIVLEPGSLQGRDAGWDDFLSRDGTSRFEPRRSEHVTGVLFSSGTTGTPKAIPWTQTTPLKCVMDAHFHQDVHPEDVVCWPTNIGWMMGPWLIYASLVSRATMALYHGAPAGSGFARFVREAEVSVLGVVPSMVRTWRDEESVGEDDWDQVRVFSSTGEASSVEDYRWLMSRAGFRAPVIEYLGGTEIGGGHLAGTVLEPCAPTTFTTPALGVDFVILDEAGKPVAEGETGELFLLPPALGMSQRLLNASHDEVYYDGCPSGPEGQVLRRHGDRIQRLPGGRYKAQGRADDAMNLGGIKVGALELERVVNEHPAVFESAAVSVSSPERLVLYVVPRTETPAETLRQELSREIADRVNPLFKVDDVVFVEALPRTATNKIMRRELRSSYAARSLSSKARLR